MEEAINALLINKSLIASLLGWFSAQTIKAIVLTIRDKKFRFNLYSLPGGFPSSHSATSAALAAAVGMLSGFDSPIFAIAAIFAFFIIYDARVIRVAAGKQAQSLNRLIESLELEEAEDVEKVREVLGHSLIEIFFGIVIGIVVAFVTINYL
ncbi:MAG: divergent PAP2 family protein [Candidatus Pacebacteria bacterium]|nr:divergent PAP2 family protein [Candidatus Paceibacterota bacterium]